MAEATFSRYDAADYLRTEEDIQIYLEAALEEGEASIVAVALGNVERSCNISPLACDSR